MKYVNLKFNYTSLTINVILKVHEPTNPLCTDHCVYICESLGQSTYTSGCSEREIFPRGRVKLRDDIDKTLSISKI